VKPRVLYVAHNHPDIFPGGAELHALEVYRAVAAGGQFEPYLLACTRQRGRRGHDGTVFRTAGDDRRQTLLYADPLEFDYFFGQSRNRHVTCLHLREFLEALRPDVIHFQHTQHLGYDFVREARNTLPDAAIVYTLHEYLPICHADGQMVRTTDRALCEEESPARCHECFPDYTPAQFFLRKRLIQSHLGLVDLFLAPSHFLLERYAAWGIPRSQLRFLDYGRSPLSPARHPARGSSGSRPRFGFFGQLNPFKGIDVLLEAMAILHDRGRDDLHLFVHGANLDIQEEWFKASLTAQLDRARAAGNVTIVGPYRPHEMAARIQGVDWVVVPSIWWENSPLVIQEAFLHRRPVICSDVGGSAEKVADGVAGLHFRVGDATALADAVVRAATTPGLWERCREGVPPVYSMDEAMAEYAEIYRCLLERRRAGTSAASV